MTEALYYHLWAHALFLSSPIIALRPQVLFVCNIVQCSMVLFHSATHLTRLWQTTATFPAGMGIARLSGTSVQLDLYLSISV